MKYFSPLFLTLLLTACFDSSSKSPADTISCAVTNQQISFTDQDFSAGFISGQVTIELPTECDAQSIQANWFNTASNTYRETDPLTLNISAEQNTGYSLTIPENSKAPNQDETLQIAFIKNDIQHELNLEITDRVHVKGPGGSETTPWYYGSNRPFLELTAQTRGDQLYCIFDNGKVLIHDFNYDDDLDLQGKRIADDITYPAYEFNCTDSNVNEHRKVTTLNDMDEDFVDSYSMINDAMFYGTLVYKMYEDLLDKAPMDKIRIRTHFGEQTNFNIWAHWDGAYVNFNDVLYEALGSTSLDTVTHEITHGILNEHTALVYTTDAQYSTDALTLHEAFSDMASVMAYHYYYGELNWIIGDENEANSKRYLDKIETEYGAIASYLDYDDGGNNQYKRMGMMTYPFYLLTEKWDIELAFKLFLSAAQSCWTPSITLQHAAECVYETAKTKGHKRKDVVDAFRAVKIQLQDEDSLAHFTHDQKKLRVQFTDNSQSDRSITAYQWDFGDGHTSTEASPFHEYANAGNYTPTLNITDSENVTDAFVRNIDITDKYCSPLNPSSVHRKFDTVSINATDINYTEGQYDYTDLAAIDVVAGSDFSVMVSGTVIGTERPTTKWQAWIDYNDDGFYSYSTNEILHESEQENNEYSLNTQFNIPVQYIGETLYLRLSGGTFGSFDPCHALKDSMIDVKINVVEN